MVVRRRVVQLQSSVVQAQPQSRPEQAAASPAISKPQLWLDQAYSSGLSMERLWAWAQALALGGWSICLVTNCSSDLFSLKSTFFLWIWLQLQSDMLTQGHGVHVKHPMSKLTIDNLVKLVLSSHCENIAAAEAHRLPPHWNCTSYIPICASFW